jgi:HPr kinase/phosphorylase
VTAKLTAGRLYDRLHDVLALEPVPGTDYRNREITSPNVSSPGLVLAGYVERFPAHRLQVFGETEMAYLASLEEGERRRILGLFFSFPIPCVFITKGQQPSADMTECAAAAGVPIICSRVKTGDFYTRIKAWLEEELAPTTTLHGSLADIFGVGLLLVGRSGIGKSECVLDLVERGHRLVADDVVIVSRRGNEVLIGRGHELQRHYMEIRGVGLVDVPSVFGIRAVRQQKRIEVVVELVDWDPDLVVDRTGLDRDGTAILDVTVPKIVVPLNPGKNITVIAEVIAMNHLLKYSGVDPAERFNERLMKTMRRASEVRRYLQEDYE